MPISTAHAAAKITHRQMFSGTVVTASGHAVSSVTVKVHAKPQSAGAHGILIGSATTAKNGTWSLPAPSYASLPKAARQAELANMGYLNAEAVVT